MRTTKQINLVIVILLATATILSMGCATITGEAQTTKSTTSPPVSIAPPTTVPTTIQVTVRVFPSQDTGIINATPEEARGWLSYNSIQFHLLDVRTPDEFAAGHIGGAINIDYESADFGQNIDKLDKNAYYIVYCRTGARSSAASAIMLKDGFIHIVNMTGGITEWMTKGFEVVK
jgi:phage shock protein E